MQRKSLAALIALAALPVAVIAITATGTAASSSAPATSAAAHAWLTGSSGEYDGSYLFGTDDNDCHYLAVSASNPSPGQVATISITGGGMNITVTSTNANFGKSFDTMPGNTSYTITWTDPSGGSSSLTATTPGC